MTLDPAEEIGPQHLQGAGLVYAGGDDFHCLKLPDYLQPGQKIVYVIEYTPETRQQILNLDRDRGMVGRLKGHIWLMKQERLRQRAFRAAHGLQSNGYPAHDVYAHMCTDTLLYLDGRMTPDLFATEAEMAAREAHLSAGGPLRLVFSGRLEAMKGAQDLIPVARRLSKRGVDFTLDIFGTGSLQAEVAEGIGSLPEPRRVRLHGAVDFETELVPFTRQQADLFLGCHRQSDPSCTYIEAMGCGVSVASYGNRMWQRLNGESQGGWDTPLGKPELLADRIAEVAQDRAELARHSRNAWTFSRRHGFLPEFRRRMEHLARIAGVALPEAT
ncbi:glycosyltransferase [Tabrizicola sp.]|uniref:glycosyltransferase n=1 Tax=Tabrizicola sp. TaxID=2005166 RepID=UPI0035B4B392